MGEFAVEFYLKAVKEIRNDNYFYIYLAHALIKLNRTEEALEWLDIL
jgi:hypothetical protein